MTLPAKSCFLNFLLPTDLTELPLKIRFRVRMVSLCFITCDNGDRHFQLQTALCVSINNLATHYTSVLECPSSQMIAYYCQLSTLIALQFPCCDEVIFKGVIEGLLLQETCQQCHMLLLKYLAQFPSVFSSTVQLLNT